MSLHAVKILGINITISPKKEILEFLQKYMDYPDDHTPQMPQKSLKPLIIVTPNPEQVVWTRRDPRFADMLNRADVALPDGIGISWALRFLHAKPPTMKAQPIPGVEFMENLVSEAVEKRVPIALIGGRGNLAAKAFDCLHKKYSRPASPDASQGGSSQKLEGWAVDAPEFTIQSTNLQINKSANQQTESAEQYVVKLARRIIDTHVGIVFVGLGAPKQEYFIERIAQELSFRPPSRNPQNKQWIPGHLPARANAQALRAGARDDNRAIILMSVGGSFDEISGRLPKPPQFVVSFRLKWFWRLILEPWRIRRQLSLLKFVWLVLKRSIELCFKAKL